MVKRLDDTPINWAALNLLNEWVKQEKDCHYRYARLRPLFQILANALAIEARDEPDTEQLVLPFPEEE